MSTGGLSVAGARAKVAEKKGLTNALSLFIRRRHFIVDKKFQFKLMIVSTAYVLFFLVVTAIATFYPLIRDLERPGYLSDEVLRSVTTFLYLHAHFWPAALFALVAICLHSISTSHKIAGPLYRFKKVFNSIAQGEIPGKIRLRKNDHLQNEAEHINRMLSALRDNIGALKEESGKMTIRLEELRKSLARKDLDEALNNLGEVEEIERNLRELLAAWK